MDEVLRSIAELRMGNGFSEYLEEHLEIGSVADYEMVRGNIIPQLINKNMNKDVLVDRPYTLVEDLAVVYTIELVNTTEDSVSSPITNAILREWNISINELHEQAIKNLSKVKVGVFQKMSEFMMNNMMQCGFMDEFEDEEIAEEMLGQLLPQDDTMYVLSSKDSVNGASQIFNKELMEMVVERIGSDFYVLPSNIHMLILVKNEAGIHLEHLLQMVMDANESEVLLTEKLSDNIYRWTASGGLKIVEQ